MMRKTIAGIAVLLLAGFGQASAAAAETTISVQVTNEYKKPVENASVILDFLGSRNYAKLGRHKRVHWEIHTDLHGYAQFPPVPQGTVQLQVIARDYQTFGQKYDVDSEEKAIDIMLEPPQKQYSAHPAPKPKD